MKYIVKRNNTLSEYLPSNIIIAIKKAMGETIDGVDEPLAKEIASKITEIVDKSNNPLNVEEIQDLVENYLMESDRKDVAKRYIIYRYERGKSRTNNRTLGHLLSDKFISKYKHMESPMDQLGNFVYYRTYSRWLPNEGRREYWWETVRRSVEYNCRLANSSVKEAEELYDNVFHLRQFLSGRTFWVGGTKVAYDFPTANFNCFRRNTEFLTRYGLTTFEYLKDGDVVEVLDGNGGWAPSLVRNYGKAKLYKLTLRKQGTVYTEDIYTTDNHLWFVNKYDRFIKKSTIELNRGDVLKYQKRYNKQKLNLDPIGIIHGIIYGDGSYNPEKNHCQIRLCGDKVKLLKYLKGYPHCKIKGTDDIFVYGLPYNFKQLPYTFANVEYIKGFLLGLILTDGDLSSGGSKISQKDPRCLKQIQSLFEIIGIPTNELKEEYRTNNNFNIENRHYYTLTIHRDSLYKHYSDYITPVQNIKPVVWVVDSVEETNIIEDVWCVEVPTTQSFTLRGGIHTHNCASTVVDRFEAFKDLFYLLMVGAGVGLRILKSDVEKLPKVRTNINLYHDEYNPLQKYQRIDSTTLQFISNNTVKIIVGDSKSGWVQALDYYLRILWDNDYKSISNILVNYDMVRPKGEVLKTFGGTASGYQSLKNMFVKINKIIKKYSSQSDKIKLKTIDCLDISNIIGENVVVGGVRRTAELMLIDDDDEEVINAKDNLYEYKDGSWIPNTDILHRSMSNNSIFYRSKPTRERLHWLLEKMRYSGEPGWVNEEAALKRRNVMKCVNPCGEILLDNNGMCNLTTVNVLAFVENGKMNKERLFNAQRLAARSAFRMTQVELELPEWNKIQQRDHITGCSLTGWQDMVNAVGFGKEDQELLLQELREITRETINKYCDELGIKEYPDAVTTVKPEGTLSQLPGVSSGVHYSHSPYFLRRVRINANDPLVKVCEELGYSIHPEVGQDINTCSTKVIEFPCKAPEGRTKYDVSAIEQLENYKMFMENYVDHNCSITVHVRDNEWEEVEQWVWDNWDDTVALTFLSLDDSFYQLMPYEAINREEYEKRVKEMKPFIPSLLQKYEKQEVEIDAGTSECQGSVCPIR